MIKLKTIFQEYSDCAFPILAASKRELTHDAKFAHALIDALEEWHSLHPHEETYFDILEAADNILREKYGMME